MGRIVVAGAGGPSGEAVCDALRAAGHEVVPVTREQADLADAAGITAYAQQVADAGPVDGLVHLAGGWRGGGGVAGQSDADWDFLAERVLDTLRRTSRAFFPALAAAGGRLVIVSTTGLDAPRASNANYLAVKAAAEAWTQALGHELAKSGGSGEILRVMALYTDDDRAANPDKDYAAWTHVEDLGRQIAQFFA